MSSSLIQLEEVEDIQQIRETAYSYIHNESILFDQREAEIRQQLEQDYQRGLEERRKQQDNNYQQTFQDIRSKFGDSPAKGVVEDIERKVHLGLYGERCKDTELAQQQQNVFDQKRQQMAQAREEQIPHDIQPVVKAMEIDPAKFEESLTWDTHVAYFHAKCKAEGYAISEPYSITVGTPPMTFQVPGGEVAQSVNWYSADVAADDKRIPKLTREGLLQESQLSQLIVNNPEHMDKILSRNLGEAESFAEDLRHYWKTLEPDKARDSILMLCTANLEFHHDFQELTHGVSKEESVQQLNETLISAFPEKKPVAVIEPTKAAEIKAAPAQKEPPMPPKRVSALDEVERENSKPVKKFKEKTLEF